MKLIAEITSTECPKCLEHSVRSLLFKITTASGNSTTRFCAECKSLFVLKGKNLLFFKKADDDYIERIVFK